MEKSDQPDTEDRDLKELVTKLAISGETEQLKEILLQNKQLWNIKDWTGDSLLAIACWQNKYETAKMLVELGFDVDSANQNGSTPLHRACYRKNIELVILLTNHGANYSLRDKSGRRPADVGDRVVRKVIQELERISEEEKERETLAQMEMEHEREMALAQVREEEHLEVVHKRQHGAVPIVVQGARFHRVNGCYEPVDEIHQDWPVYSLRGDRDIWMVYVGNEWLIQSTKDKGTHKAYVRLKCEEPTYPELRIEGNKGVIESTFSMVFGVPFQFSSQFDSKIAIMTEDEAAAVRATEMFKLAEEKESEQQNIEDPSRSSDSALHSAVHSSGQSTLPTTRSARSQSDDMSLYTNSGPLHYEEEELIQHYEQQQEDSPLHQQQDTPASHSNPTNKSNKKKEMKKEKQKNEDLRKELDEVSELLTHSEDDGQHHEL